MTSNEKLAMVKAILRVTDDAMDSILTTYLAAAKSEILGWRYSYAASIPDEVPTEYEMTQVQAVVNGYTQSGNEGQVVSIENGVHRHFYYDDMVAYIRARVIPYAKLAGQVSADATE